MQPVFRQLAADFALGRHHRARFHHLPRGPKNQASSGPWEMQATSLVQLSEGENARFQQSSGTACFTGMSLPVEEMASAGAALGRIRPDAAER